MVRSNAAKVVETPTEERPTRLAPPHHIRLRDVRIRQRGAYPRPSDQEFGLAVVEVNAVPAVVVERQLAVKVAAPPPANATDFHDPAYRQAAPDHGEVVGATIAPDHGVAQGNGFVVGHFWLVLDQCGERSNLYRF